MEGLRCGTGAGAGVRYPSCTFPACNVAEAKPNFIVASAVVAKDAGIATAVVQSSSVTCSTIPTILLSVHSS